jgi:hypothetical protein
MLVCGNVFPHSIGLKFIRLIGLRLQNFKYIEFTVFYVSRSYYYYYYHYYQFPFNLAYPREPLNVWLLSIFILLFPFGLFDIHPVMCGVSVH